MRFQSFLPHSLSVLLLSTASIPFGTPIRAMEVPSESYLTAQATSTDVETIFNQAKQDLPENYYQLYRIVERIARANQVDNLPWRVAILPEYDVNAFATDVNLVAFYNGLLDRLDGDPNAIACVVGHEMAHHVKNHIAVGMAEREQILQQLRAEAVEEVAAEEADLRGDLEALGISEWVTGGAGVVLGSFLQRRSNAGGILGLGVNIIGGLIQNGKERRVQEATERIETIYAEKEAQRLREWQELNHHQEFEADELGYVYITRAGFNPQGCQTVMTVLSRLGITASETHPATPDRMTALNSFATQYPQASLVNEGKANLAANPMPLTYEPSLDQSTLRINSRAGSRNFDTTFPDN